MAEEPIPVVILSRKLRRGVSALSRRSRRGRGFRVAYGVFAVLVLLGTTLLWALLGARVQGHNADQLSDPYLFSSLRTFHGAAFPGAHTMLLKWPVFWLLAVLGVTSSHLIAATLGLVLVTVGTLAFILYRIDRRPLVFGTVCLGLSLALLLVPAQPYAGALLPVNMAMLTTRNIEYAVYLLALGLFARAKRLRTWHFAGGVVLLAVLIASDKLFMSLSVGGALLALVVYALLRAWPLVVFAVRWLAGSIIAAIAGAAVLAGISAAHVTHIVSGGSATPYGLATGGKDLALGLVYSLLGLLTNAGANPVYDNRVLRNIPDELKHRLWSLSGPAYLAAAAALLYVLLLAWRIAWRGPRTRPRTVPVASLLALGLIWSTVAAFGVFIVTNHSYVVDARYLTIGFFALAVTVSVGLRRQRWPRPGILLTAACLLLCAIVLAGFTVLRISRTQTAALHSLTNRNNIVADTLQHHKTKLLVGDYWRVLPIKLAMRSSLNAMPLSGCTQPETALTSTAWQPDLHKTSFAYLLTRRGSITNFPDCTIQQVVAAYGQPNATQVVSGTLADPDETILFYDHGIDPKPAPAAQEAAATTILPITLDQLPDTGCTAPTIFNAVAHQDDDLLFLNPDLLHEIQVGDCVRTVYVTAGNDGQGRLYWLSRQLGAEAAYDEMLGQKHVWVQRTVQMSGRQYVTVASPRGNHKISLIFMNLPDGNLDGQGFPMQHYESLAKLQAGAIPTAHTVDGQSQYTEPQLLQALSQLMVLYRPAEIHTQADMVDAAFPDHSDHIATSRLTQVAAAAYDQEEYRGAVTTPLKRYIGYPIQGYPANVAGDDLAAKQAAFFAYARFDGGVCGNVVSCEGPTYGLYLARQYQE